MSFFMYSHPSSGLKNMRLPFLPPSCRASKLTFFLVPPSDKGDGRALFFFFFFRGVRTLTWTQIPFFSFLIPTNLQSRKVLFFFFRSATTIFCSIFRTESFLSLSSREETEFAARSPPFPSAGKPTVHLSFFLFFFLPAVEQNCNRRFSLLCIPSITYGRSRRKEFVDERISLFFGGVFFFSYVGCYFFFFFFFLGGVFVFWGGGFFFFFGGGVFFFFFLGFESRQ